jgi:hypothetical protein
LFVDAAVVILVAKKRTGPRYASTVVEQSETPVRISRRIGSKGSRGCGFICAALETAPAPSIARRSRGFHLLLMRTLGVLPSVRNQIAPPSLKLMLNASESDDIPPMPERTLPFRAVKTAVVAGG